MFRSHINPQTFWLILSGTTIISILLIFYVINFSPKSSSSSSPTLKETKIIPSQPEKSLPLEVSTPLEKFVTDSALLTITGQAPKRSLVSVTGGAEDNITQADENGKFVLPTTLNEGENTLTISAFELDGQQRQIERSVIFSSEGL